MKNKGQVTLWVILALFLVASIILFFLVNNKIIVNPINNQVQTPNSFLDKCVRDSTNEALDKMLPRGGFLNPLDVKTYNDIDIAYLCKNRGNYQPCINQHPMLINEMKKEVEGYITPIVEGCLNDYKNEMQKKNYDVSINTGNLSVSFSTNRVYVDINRKITLTKDEKTNNYDEVKVEILNPAYDLANVAIEIANNEAKYCSFEYQGYSILNPRFDIRKFVLSDATKIYTIQDKDSGKKMNIAIRGCAIPPGI